MPAHGSSPTAGETLRFEGETFTIDATEVFRANGDGGTVLRPGVMHADLPENVLKMERRQYDIYFNAADAVWSEKHKAWCLRGRGVHVHPETGDYAGDTMQAALTEAGEPARWMPDTF